ncbi:hypothetical protein HL667_06385 [Bradyrhizobium sp. 83012]|uniref:Phosphatidate cytidylyltransferase n=1 Tax=Bradyrhizobium aeschynomenes TaxID=2734909 RepID=A0ABX2CAH7_9BRAD|nr:hypothetical protein [Bradyrhizobium aeschynomenes]NPU64620.1 hypothetical protein [Bradyrhizobium aeschynomenes]
MRDRLINLGLALGLVASVILLSILCGATWQGVLATVLVGCFSVGAVEVIHWLYELIATFRGWFGWLS